MGGNFTHVNIKTGGRHNIRKHKEINNTEQYIALDISLEIGNMENMKITTSEPKYYLGRSGKGLITSLGIKTIRSLNKIKNSRFAITEVSIQFFYIINKFLDLPYEEYVRKRSKHTS